MSGSTCTGGQPKDLKEGGGEGCKVSNPNGSLCGETESLGILEQFQKLYAERLKRLDGDSEVSPYNCYISLL